MLRAFPRGQLSFQNCFSVASLLQPLATLAARRATQHFATSGVDVMLHVHARAGQAQRGALERAENGCVTGAARLGSAWSREKRACVQLQYHCVQQQQVSSLSCVLRAPAAQWRPRTTLSAQPLRRHKSRATASLIFLCALILSHLLPQIYNVHQPLDVEGVFPAPRAAPCCLQRHLAFLEL